MINRLPNKIFQNTALQLFFVLLTAFLALNFHYSDFHYSDFHYSDPRPRPSDWAVPIITKHLENCYRLDDKLYRSAQPDKDGFREALKLGITEVLNLRSMHSDDDEAEGLNLKVHRVKMEAGGITESEIIAALKVIRDSKGPLLVHCRHGSDRTGAVCAFYRIIFQNRSKKEAIDELVYGGYGFHTIYSNIPRLIESSDIGKIKKELFRPEDQARQFPNLNSKTGNKEMKTALLLIDIQNDYFPGGRMELKGSMEAGRNAGKILKKFRLLGLPVIHIQHVSLRPGSTFFIEETEGVKIHKSVEPSEGETVIIKHYPNSFRETGLLEKLRSMGVTNIVAAGMMTHMCIDATLRAAFDHGFSTTVAHDACATRDLIFNGRTVSAEDVHASFLSALGSVYATVKSTEEVLAQEF